MPMSATPSIAEASVPPTPPDKPALFLRQPIEADRAEYLALRRASRKFLEPWDSIPPGRTKADNYNEGAFDRMLATSRLESSIRFLIIASPPDTIIGAIGIGNIVRGAFQSCTLGYWIGSAYSNQGHMTQALSLSLAFIFKALKLHRVEANIIPTNKPSTRLIKRLGFRYEGLGRRYIRINGKWQDHARWGLTNEDYRELVKRKSAIRR